ncbi:MAG: sortase [Bacilli bacterium]|nr:sortase [Bacilli bacterium]MDD4794999.1 sortase [Bacilli bacterium]
MTRKKEKYKIFIIFFLLLLNTSSNIAKNKQAFTYKHQEIINTQIIKTKTFYAKIKIPKISLDKSLSTYDSLDNNVNKSIEILYPSIMPNQEKGLLILAAHSGNSKVSFFKDLYLLEKDDLIYINYNNYIFNYKIINIERQNKTGEISINKNVFNNILILTTCDQEDKSKQIIITAVCIDFLKSEV